MGSLEDFLKPEDRAKLLKSREVLQKNEETLSKNLERYKLDLSRETPVGSVSVHEDDNGNIVAYSNEETQKITIENKVVDKIKINNREVRTGSKIYINDKEEIQIDGIATDGNHNLVYYRTIKNSPMGQVKISDSKTENDFIKMIEIKNGVVTTDDSNHKGNKAVDNSDLTSQGGSSNRLYENDRMVNMVKEKEITAGGNGKGDGNEYPEKVDPSLESKDTTEIEKLQNSIYKLTEEKRVYLKNKLDTATDASDKIKFRIKLEKFERSPYQTLQEDLEYNIGELAKKIDGEKIKGKRASLERILLEDEKSLETINKALNGKVPLEMNDFNTKGIVFESGKFVNDQNAKGMLFRINRYLKGTATEYEIVSTIQKGKTKYVNFKDKDGKIFEISTINLAEMIKSEEIYNIKGGSKIEILSNGKKTIYEIISRDRENIVFKEEGYDIEQKTTLDKMRDILHAKDIRFNIVSNDFQKIKFGEKMVNSVGKGVNKIPETHKIVTPDGSVYDLKGLNEKQVELFHAILSDIGKGQISREDITTLNNRMTDDIKLPKENLLYLLYAFDKKNPKKDNEGNIESSSEEAIATPVELEVVQENTADDLEKKKQEIIDWFNGEMEKRNQAHQEKVAEIKAKIAEIMAMPDDETYERWDY